MIIKNEDLQVLFYEASVDRNWNDFFKEVDKIVSYTINTKFHNIVRKNYDTESVKQDCLVKVWNLIEKGQIKAQGNIFSYIIGTTSFIMRDFIRKENRRKSKVNFVSLDTQKENV